MPVKGLYVEQWREGLQSQEQIDAMLKFANANEITDLFIQAGREEKFLSKWSQKPTRIDYLQYICENRGKINVHAWVNVSLLWRAKFRIQGRFPDEWIISDAPFHEANWTKEDTREYFNFTNPEVRDYIIKKLSVLVSNYDIQGINLEGMRWPGGTVTPNTNQEKIDALDILMENISASLRAIKTLPISLVVSAIDNIETKDHSHYMQWLSNGRLDMICPMLIGSNQKQDSIVQKMDASVWFIFYPDLDIQKAKEFISRNNTLLYSYAVIKNATSNI